MTDVWVKFKDMPVYIDIDFCVFYLYSIYIFVSITAVNTINYLLTYLLTRHMQNDPNFFRF